MATPAPAPTPNPDEWPNPTNHSPAQSPAAQHDTHHGHFGRHQSSGRHGVPGQSPKSPGPGSPFTDSTYHLKPVKQICSELQTDEHRGINASDAAQRLERDGPNTLTPPKKKHVVLRIGGYFISGFSMLFIAGAILCLIVFKVAKPPDWQSFWLGIVLLIVVVISGFFEWYQDHKANKVLAGFKSLTTLTSTVVRDGAVATIDSSTLVKGDLLVLEMGIRVPADVRLTEVHSLKVDNSTLTGETEPLPRSVDSFEHNAMESPNLAFAGTFIADGRGMGIVISTGDNTVLGHIAKHTQGATPPESTLEKELRHFVIAMAIGALAFAIFLVLLGIFKVHLPWRDCIALFIAGIMANIPEGLLPQLKAQLALTAKRMVKSNVLVKSTPIIETLGCTTVIASDKTGTLTQNKMTCVHLWYDEQIVDAANPPTTASFPDLHRVAALCNQCSWQDETGEIDPATAQIVRGNPSEAALLRFAQRTLDVRQFRREYPIVADIPFNSVNKWMLTVHRHTPSGQFLVLMKGAPERVLEHCDFININGVSIPLSQKQKLVEEANYRLASDGERVLGCAFLPLPPAQYPDNYVFSTETMNFPVNGLIFCGLAALCDPPRPAVPGAIKLCQQASIKVVMVTGDHPVTARAIARQVNIMPGRTREEEAAFRSVPVESIPRQEVEAVVVHGGEDLPNMTEEEWDYVLTRKQIVFARTLPRQKQEIVERLQKLGNIVAVTGDGTNDCPALKQANVGVAMGMAGSDVAKDAADIILMDDNFDSLVKGVEQGRLIYHNMKKCVMYTLCHLTPEAVTFTLYLICDIPLGMETIMVLLIDLGSELFPAVSLAWEPGEQNIMTNPPRDAKRSGLTNWRLFFWSYVAIGFWESAICYCLYFYVFAHYGFSASDIYGKGRNWAEDEPDSFRELEMKNTKWVEKNYDSFYDYRVHVLDVAQSAYIWTIMVCQIGNLLGCRTKYMSMFRFPFNKYTLFGIISAILILILALYIPALHSVFGTDFLPPQFVFVAFAVVPVMVFLEEMRKIIVRRFPHCLLANVSNY